MKELLKSPIYNKPSERSDAVYLASNNECIPIMYLNMGERVGDDFMYWEYITPNPYFTNANDDKLYKHITESNGDTGIYGDVLRIYKGLVEYNGMPFLALCLKSEFIDIEDFDNPIPEHYILLIKNSLVNGTGRIFTRVFEDLEKKYISELMVGGVEIRQVIDIIPLTLNRAIPEAPRIVSIDELDKVSDEMNNIIRKSLPPAIKKIRVRGEETIVMIDDIPAELPF